MKKAIILTTILLFGLTIWAEKNLWIYEKNTTVRSTPQSSVDSIGFTTDLELQLYQDGHPTYINSVHAIDSVIFIRAEERLPPVVNSFYSEFVPAGGNPSCARKPLLFASSLLFCS